MLNIGISGNITEMPSSDEENENQSSDDEGNLSNSSGADDNDDDSQSSNEGGGRHRSSGINLTGFLFGNIDTEGKLEEDILDDESKRQLSTLARLGLMSMLENVIHEDDQGNKDSGDSDDDGAKSPTAEDYSDINELAEDEGGSFIDDSILMPPPPTPTSRSASALDKKKLETPLAAMLPSKYANIDVRELFPDFRPDKVLCFSRLFGPGKPSSLPQIWRGVKKKKKKKKPPEFGEPEEEIEYKEIFFNFGPPPPPEMCRLDDDIRFLKPLEETDSSEDAGKNADDKKGPNVADWRFGPAQLWYDIIGVPEAGILAVLFFNFVVFTSHE